MVYCMTFHLKGLWLWMVKQTDYPRGGCPQPPQEGKMI